MAPYNIPNIGRFPVHSNHNGFLQYLQMEMSLNYRVKNEDVLHKFKDERNILYAINEGRMACGLNLA